MNLIFNATTVDGNTVTYKNPIYFHFKAEYYNIAHHFSAAFPERKEKDLLLTCSIYLDGRCIMNGMVDLQKDVNDKDGRLFKVEATCSYAAMKQNQVQPVILENYSSASLYEDYAKPYGVLKSTLHPTSCSYLNITPGMTAWDAIFLFCRQRYHYMPRISRNGALCAYPDDVHTLYIGNTAPGEKYTHLFYYEKLSDVISHVHVKVDGSTEYDYSTVLDNFAIEGYNIQRERFFNPPKAWKTLPEKGGYELILNANKDSHGFEITIPKLLDAYPRDNIVFTDPEYKYKSTFYVGRVDLHADQNGYYTKLLIFDYLRIY